VFSRRGPAYGTGCTDQTGLSGNISADPRFARFYEDYHLTVGSPAADAGDNNATGITDRDLEGVTRVLDGDSVPSAVIDMGAYEISPTPVIALQINGEFASPYHVFTSGRALFSLAIPPTTYTQPVASFWAIVLNGQAYWITAHGVSLTPAPLLIGPPAALTSATLLDLTLPAGTTMGSVFFMVGNGGMVTAAGNNVTVVYPY
jgi:hypothetical protein